MEQVEEKFTQTDFNRWLARNDETVTYKEAKEEAEIHGLNLGEALIFASLFPGGEGL